MSVQLGSEVLHGVLYHPDQPVDSSTSIPQYNGALVPYGRGRRRRLSGRRRRGRRAGDPSYPKPNRSGYNFFFAEKHYKLKSLYPNREREFTKMIGQSWTNLSAEERMVKFTTKTLFPSSTSVHFSPHGNLKRYFFQYLLFFPLQFTMFLRGKLSYLNKLYHSLG